jgi:hypothetical protein
VITVEPFSQAQEADGFNSKSADVEMAKDGKRRLFINPILIALLSWVSSPRFHMQ